MRPVRTINSWTCFPASVASILHLDLQTLFTILGHDGSEFVRESDGLMGRRGFHPQEMIQVAQNRHFSVTQIDRLPSARPTLEHSFCYFKTIVGEDCELRFDRQLFQSFGWIECRTQRGTGHAIAYDNATLFDPSTGEAFKYQSVQDAESRGLYLLSLFRLDSMENS